MSYKHAIETRKEELVTLEKALKKAKKDKNQKSINFLELRIKSLKKSIEDLEKKLKEGE